MHFGIFIGKGQIMSMSTNNRSEPTIDDFEKYIARMNRSILDKLFFVDKIDVDVIVDFGCGDGTLLSYTKMWLPSKPSIGFDHDSTMVSKHKDIVVTSNWEEIEKFIEGGKKVGVILSSIIHEVYHYGNPKDISLFWERIFSGKFSTIIVRDMIPSVTINRTSDNTEVMRILNQFNRSKVLLDFETIWGSIRDNKNLIHFLLKYQYIEPNWEREVRENYLPLYREDFLAKIPAEYDIIYHEHFVLPYLNRRVKDDFGFRIKDNTHLKVILERN